MSKRIHGFRSPEALDAGLGIVVRPDDVFIATYSKSGTTWVQQVVHGLRSGGSMEFGEISEVVPWLESALDMGIVPDADQAWSPRAFKSHLMWCDVPKGGRYITVFRDPLSVLPSFYRFLEGWWFEPGTVTVEEFATEFYMAGSASGRHWDHLVDWWPQIDRPNVLVLCYEDMVQVPHQVAPTIADFLGIALDTTAMDVVVRQSSRDFMAAHAFQFDEHMIRAARDEVWGLPAGGDTAKVRTASPALAVPENVRVALAEVWSSTVESALAFEDYDALRKALPNPLGARR